MATYQATYLNVSVWVNSFANDETYIDVPQSRIYYAQRFQELLLQYLVHRYGYPELDGVIQLEVTVTYAEDTTSQDTWHIISTDAPAQEQAVFKETLAAVAQTLQDADIMTDIIVANWDALEKHEWRILEAKVRQMLEVDVWTSDPASVVDRLSGKMVELQITLLSLDRVRASHNLYLSGKKLKRWMLQPTVDTTDAE